MTTTIRKTLAKDDDVLAKIIPSISLTTWESTGNVFHDLLSCIIEQQIHYRSTKNIFTRLLGKAGLNELEVANFPIFEEKALSQIKLSTRKLETIERVVQVFTEEETIDWLAKDDQAVRKILGGIKGIGPWTIEMILLFTLQRTDIFPVDDYHLKLVMEQLYPLHKEASKKAQLKAIASRWAPYRSFAVQYLWAWKTLQKKGMQ